MKKRDDNNTDIAELDRQVDIAHQPKLIMAAGRGKTGKSSLLRLCIEQSRGRGGTPIIADGDRTNPTLEAFFPDALRPPSAEDDDVQTWLNNLADTLIDKRATAYLDLGGGDQLLRVWAKCLDLGPFLVSHGVTPVLLHVLGNDLDDLVYLRDLEEVFAPEHTAIVLNEGMVPVGRAPVSAFKRFFDRTEFTSVVERGAKIVRIPRLSCMQDIDDRRLSFADAATGKVKPGQERIGPTMQQQILMWKKAAVANLEPIAGWLT